jgi:hypothetical protein
LILAMDALLGSLSTSSWGNPPVLDQKVFGFLEPLGPTMRAHACERVRWWLHGRGAVSTRKH